MAAKNTSDKSKTNEKTPKRSSIRFPPDFGDYAQVEVATRRGDFKPDALGLILEESYKGCGLVLQIHEKLVEGAKIRVQIGRGPVLRAEIRWRKDLDSQVMRVGLLYLD